jgi:hypothetical protein
VSSANRSGFYTATQADMTPQEYCDFGQIGSQFAMTYDWSTRMIARLVSFDLYLDCNLILLSFILFPIFFVNQAVVDKKLTVKNFLVERVKKQQKCYHQGT